MIERYLLEVWNIILDLGFPLLLGIAIAGIVHVVLPAGFVHRNFGGRGLKSIIKASLIGVPMPLCSCGVIPTAIGLKQDGASNGASTGFLISTPQTGIDSILVSATFLGWPFAIFKLVVAFIAGIIGGAAVDLFDPEEAKSSEENQRSTQTNSKKSKIAEAIDFGIFELFGMIYRWLIIGILLAALISIIFPTGYLASISWIGGIGGLFLMLLISLPLYVCATASVPIAASLIGAGMPLGAAMVLLMAGPASNIATIGAIFRAFGGKVLAIYLLTVSVLSIFFGWLFDFIIVSDQIQTMHHHVNDDWFAFVCALIMVGLIIFMIIYEVKHKINSRKSNSADAAMDIKLTIEGMTCQHCALNVTKTLESVDGVTAVKTYLDDGMAYINGDVNADELIASLKTAGFNASVN
jgi:hypothetical protein